MVLCRLQDFRLLLPRKAVAKERHTSSFKFAVSVWNWRMARGPGEDEDEDEDLAFTRVLFFRTTTPVLKCTNWHFIWNSVTQ